MWKKIVGRVALLASVMAAALTLTVGPAEATCEPQVPWHSYCWEK